MKIYWVVKDETKRKAKEISAGLHKSKVNTQSGCPVAVLRPHTLEQRRTAVEPAGRGRAFQLRTRHPSACRLSDSDVAGTPTGVFSGSHTFRTYSRLRKCVLSKGAPQMFWRKHRVVHIISPIYCRTSVKVVIVVIVIRKLGGHLDLLL